MRIQYDLGFQTVRISKVMTFEAFFNCPAEHVLSNKNAIASSHGNFLLRTNI